MAQSASIIPAALPPLPVKRTGRPLTLTTDLQERICEVIREGNPVADAALACGVPHDTHRKWIQRGRNGEEPFFAYWTSTQSALASLRQGLRGELLAAGRSDPKHWKAIEAVLMRVEPKTAQSPVSSTSSGIPSVVNLHDEAWWADFEKQTAARVALIEERKRFLLERNQQQSAGDQTLLAVTARDTLPK